MYLWKGGRRRALARSEDTATAYGTLVPDYGNVCHRSERASALRPGGVGGDAAIHFRHPRGHGAACDRPAASPCRTDLLGVLFWRKLSSGRLERRGRLGRWARQSSNRSTFRHAGTTSILWSGGAASGTVDMGHCRGPWGSLAVPFPSAAGGSRPQGMRWRQSARTFSRSGCMRRYPVLRGQFRWGTGPEGSGSTHRQCISQAGGAFCRAPRERGSSSDSL